MKSGDDGTGGGDLLALRRRLAAAEAELAAAEVGSTKLQAAFSASIAHELGNPLAYLMANLGYLREELPKHLPGFGSDACEDAAMRELALTLADARDGAARVGKIVRELECISSVTDDDPLGAVDVRVALETACKLAGAEIRRSAVLVRDYREVRKVACNESRLVRAFLNILVNAVQAIPPGNPAHHRIRLVCRGEGDRVIVEVRDTGTGIAEKSSIGAGDRFSFGPGVGLGLSTSSRILGGMGGALTVSRQVGYGTAVRVSLAAVPPVVVAESQRPSAPP